jgi:hypothetical protein
MSQVINTTVYDQVVTQTSAITLPNYQEVSYPSANTVRIAHFSSLRPNNVATAQSSSVTLSGTVAADDVVWIQIVDADANTQKYAAIANTTGETLSTLAAKLAAAVNEDNDVFASASGAVITLTSVIPGRSFTPTSGKTGTVVIGAPASVQANVGTALTRKIGEVDIVFDDSTDGFLTATGTIKFYDGASSPVLLQTQTTAAYKHPRSIDTIRTNNGGI